MEWPLGRYAERGGSGTATFASTGGASLQGPQLAADAAAEARERYLIAGAVQQSHAARRRSRSPGDVTYAFDPEAIRFEPSRIFTDRHLRRLRRRHRVRRAIEDPVSRHQPQLAGERSLPRRHHDRVRRADARDSDRRRRRVRRRDARRVPPAAHRGPLHRVRDARVGRQLGRRRRRLRRRELVRERQPRGDPRGPVADGRDRPVLARLSARRRRRGDRRAHPHRPIARWRISAKRSTCRTTTSTARCRATSTSTATTRGRMASAA